MGFELHPKNLNPEEIEFSKRAVVAYKRIRPTVQQGDLYRLASPYEKPYSALMYANEDKSHAVVFVLGLDKDGEKHVSLKLSGLADGEKYKITEINCDTPHDAKFDTVVCEYAARSIVWGRSDLCRYHQRQSTRRTSRPREDHGIGQGIFRRYGRVTVTLKNWWYRLVGVCHSSSSNDSLP